MRITHLRGVELTDPAPPHIAGQPALQAAEAPA